MKISDMIFRYPTRSISRNDGICRVRTFTNKNNEVIIVLTDLGENNPSASVTNSVERIYDSLIQKGIAPLGSTIIEHYEKNEIMGQSFDIVSFDNLGNPVWTAISLSSLLALLDCEENEFQQLTTLNARLMNEIDQARYDISPQVDFPYRESPEVIKRRFQIESKSISKASIMRLIQCGAKEQDISKLLKSDLSVWGEVYAHPYEEYICFSEFPISTGFVDFVVFSGRSRMDVYLIEVKGANFNLLNQRGYESFSSKVEEAAGQLRSRLRDIYEDYKGFKKEVHILREKVESGKSVYNSLLGPNGSLEVDPNKDINIFPILIAGRTVDDLIESKKRHDYEYSSKPTIKIESWDTWLRKLRRE